MTQKKICEVCFEKEATSEKYNGLWLCPECRRKEQDNKNMWGL